MEISSFPLLSPEDYSHLSSWFQEMDSGFNSNRRQRKDDDSGGQMGPVTTEDLKKGGFGDILASVVLLDEEAQENDQWLVEVEREKAEFDAKHNKKVREMNEYYNRFHDHYSDLDDLDTSRIKRAPKSAVASAVSATAAVSGKDGENPGNSGTGSGQPRRSWGKDRSNDWWECCSHPDFPDEEFKRAFRMSKPTFEMICEEMEPIVMKKNTMLVRQRVDIYIWRLATGEPLRVVSKRFGLGISTCHKLILEVCSAIWSVFDRLEF